MPKEVQKQIISSSHAVNGSDWGILRARIGRNHDVTVLVSQDQLFGNVALNHLVRKVPLHCFTTEFVDFKALLQR
jgi:hypothetical protein